MQSIPPAHYSSYLEVLLTVNIHNVMLVVLNVES